MNQKRQELYRKHGAGQMGGFCLFTLANMVIMIVVFISVFRALGAISNYNVNNQFIQLQEVYEQHSIAGTLDSEQFAIDINERYQETRVSFLWVANVWQPDVPWARRVLTFDNFRSTVSDVQGRVTYGADMDVLRAQYETIFYHIEDYERTWNGWLLLIILAGATTWASAVINSKVMAKTKALNNDKKDEEKEAGYSIRDVKNQKEGEAETVPTIDPAQMGKVMKLMMPIVMVIVTITMTSALAIYIIFSSLFATGFTFGVNWIIDKIIKRKEAKRKEKGPDMTIINPHAKYFKS